MTTDISLERQKELAKEHFPREWAHAETVPGERGRRLRATWRKRAVEESLLIPLRAAGASCGTCEHFGHMPGSDQRTCELDSDFHGYAITEASGLCSRWTEDSDEDDGVEFL